jgi:hypothetical protein
MTASSSLALGVCLATMSLSAFAQDAALDVLEQAAEALGGKERILALKSIQVEGHGQIAYQQGGSNVSGSPDAAQKWINLHGVQRTIDLENGRMRLDERRVHNFVFAVASNMTGLVRVSQLLDGDMAWNIAPDGAPARASARVARERRIEMLASPIVLIRRALQPGAGLEVANLRSRDDLQLLDVTTAHGDALTLAVDGTTHLPAWLSWVAPHDNLGEYTLTMHWTGYQPWDGLMFPSSYRMVSDWRNIDQYNLYVDRNAADVQLADLSAPPAVRDTQEPLPQQAPRAERVAQGVWLFTGPGGANSVLFEFADHLTLFEVPSSNERTRAILELANQTVPGKPVTEAIVSHHHFDHTGGLRAAVAAGLTIITHRDNAEIFEEVTRRPTRVFPDALGANPKPIKLRLVDDQLTLRDDMMEVVVYATIQDNHMSAGLFAHVPNNRLLVQGDLFDVGWDVMWWGNAYMDNLSYRDLQVERDVPVHGRVMPLNEVQQRIGWQIKNAQDLCARAEAQTFSLPGCPVRNLQ